MLNFTAWVTQFSTFQGRSGRHGRRPPILSPSPSIVEGMDMPFGPNNSDQARNNPLVIILWIITMVGASLMISSLPF